MTFGGGVWGLAFWKDRWHDVGMRKWSRILFGILIFAVVGGIAWLVWRPNEPM
ncbi:MAG: hypothetical protein JWR26_2076, partial [Pedosphaera sp.]|nr:hypothetical protein [Pedosphaera sp.]